MRDVLSIDHPRYEEFYDLLAGPKACDFKAEPELNLKCHGDKRLSKAILKKMGGFNIEASLRNIGERSCCDCEIVLNRLPV